MFQSHEIPAYRLLQSYDLLSPKPLRETKPQLTKSKPQVRTKENHADYSITEPYICTVEYVGNGIVFDNIMFRWAIWARVYIKEHILDSFTRTWEYTKADTIERLYWWTLINISTKRVWTKGCSPAGTIRLSGISSIADVFIFIGKYIGNEMNSELYNYNKN